ncbi:MAG: hypothetical protein HC817_07940, partial [Saprospiraceae bacterium]|nr:hypothetical protein [Saprospiraceae bacterium]
MKLILIIGVIILYNSCTLFNESEAYKAYQNLRKFDMSFSRGFIIDTRGVENKKYQIRSITFIDTMDNRYLIYPSYSIESKIFFSKNNFDYNKSLVMKEKLIALQEASNAIEIAKLFILGDFVYFTFNDGIEQ